jgi:hypothetical protein
MERDGNPVPQTPPNKFLTRANGGNSSLLTIIMRWITCLLLWLTLALSVLANADTVDVKTVPPGYEPPTVDVKSGEKFAFESENSRVLKIVINSLYKNKDIFLRELISVRELLRRRKNESSLMFL